LPVEGATQAPISLTPPIVDTHHPVCYCLPLALMAYLDTIPLERINMDDRKFSISYPAESASLLRSVRKVGIVEPVLLLDGPLFSLVSGFRRVEAAKILGLATVPAVVASDMDEKEALLHAIHENLSRGLNTVEKAVAFAKMAEAGFPAEEVFETMAILDCRPHQKVLQTYLAIAGAEDRFKAFIVSRGLSQRNIEDFLRFDGEEREKLLALFSSIHTTEGYLRDVLRLTALMKLKEGRIDFVALSGAADADDLRTRLKRRTHPMLTSLEKKLEGLRHQSALPPAIDIRVDPFFEKEYIDIRIRTGDIQELESALERLRKTLEDGLLGSILELTKG
jgi:hypothetical protein